MRECTSFKSENHKKKKRKKEKNGFETMIIQGGKE